MRVITREANQSVMIGGDTVITVLEVWHDRVRLAISSPRQVPCYREQYLYWGTGTEEAAPWGQRELSATACRTF